MTRRAPIGGGAGARVRRAKEHVGMIDLTAIPDLEYTQNDDPSREVRLDEFRGCD
jgi:hypothetical protein